MGQLVAGIGFKGMDCNFPLTPGLACLAKSKGYQFVMRYIGRKQFTPGDLTSAEVGVIHDAGLLLGLVQHFEGDGWLPTDDKGRLYGAYMGAAAAALGAPTGLTTFVDVEGVSAAADAEQVIRYVNYWSDRVWAAGLQPGAYWGWNNRLTPAQMYQRTKAVRHWGAYNLNADQYPAVRGLCMKQRVALMADAIAGAPGGIDTDTAFTDKLGGMPMFWGAP